MRRHFPLIYTKKKIMPRHFGRNVMWHITKSDILCDRSKVPRHFGRNVMWHITVSLGAIWHITKRSNFLNIPAKFDSIRTESNRVNWLHVTLFKVEWKNCVAIRLVRLHSTVFVSIRLNSNLNYLSVGIRMIKIGWIDQKLIKVQKYFFHE